MDRRTLLKIMGGIAALPALGKALKGTGIKAIKAAGKVLPKVSGMPEWFSPLVNKIMKEGTDITPKASRLEDYETIKKLEIPSKTGKSEIIKLTENKATGNITIESSSGGVADSPFEISYTPPKTDINVQTGEPVKYPGDFYVIENRPKPDYNNPGKVEFDYDTFDIDTAYSDLERLEKIGTGKIKDVKKIEQRAAGRKKVEDDPYDDIMDRYPDPNPDNYRADGGLASFANGGKAKNKLKNDEDENEIKEEDILSIFGQKLAGPVKGELFLEPVEKQRATILPESGGARELREYVKQQTPKGVGIGYSGPDYGLMAVKPLFNEADKRPLVQGYYKAGENKFIRGSAGPKEQTLNYSLGDYNPDDERTSGMDIGFSRNTQMGRPEYMFNVGARFANGGVANMFRERSEYSLGGPTKAIRKIGGPTQQEIDAFVNQPIAMGQGIPVNEFLPGEDYTAYVRRKRRETGPLLFAGEPVTMPVLPSTSTPQINVNTNPIARSLEMAGFTKEEIMKIIGERGYASGGLTKTVPPAMGPNSQGVESLFRRRYS